MARRCSVPDAVLVVAASALINFIYAGNFYIAGLFLHDFLIVFKEGKPATALVLSLQTCATYLSGLIAGPVIIKFGARIVAVIGAVLSTTGLLLSAFAPSLMMLYLTYGVMTGFSMGFLMASGAVCVQQHTSKRRALASGISFTGSALGGLIFPFIFRYSHEQYGWRGCLLFLAGLELHCLPCALMLRAPSQVPPSSLIDARLVPPPPRDESPTSKAPLKADPEAPAPTERLLSKAEEANGGPHVQVRRPPGGRLIATFSTILLSARRVILSAGWPSVACIISNAFRYSGSTVVYGYLPMKVMTLGLPKASGTHLIAAVFLGELCGRVACTLTAWMHDSLPCIIFIFFVFVAGVLETLFSLMDTFLANMALAVCFGVCLGFAVCCTTTVIRDLVGLTHMPWVLGASYAAGGVSSFLSIQLLAFVWQQTDSLALTFLIAGCLLSCSAVSIAVTKCISHKRH